MDIFPSHIRALIFILVAIGVATVFQYLFLRRQIYSFRWTALWACITGIAFVSENIWILVLFIAFLSFFLLPKKGREKLPYYFALLPIIPAYAYEIPGLPGIRYLFNLTYPRILALLIFLPLFFKYIRQPLGVRDKLFSSHLDKLVVCYVLLLCMLSFRAPSITAGLRGDFMLFLDIFLPYFVISRYIRTIDDIKQVFIAILFSALVLSFIGLLEVKFRWGLYAYLSELLDFVPSQTGQYLHSRGGIIRIDATMNSIPFGYFIAIAIGIYLYLKDHFKLSKIASLATLTLLSSVLFFTGSRGAWLTAILLVATYYFTKIRNPQMKVGIVLLSIVAAIGLVMTGSAPVYEDETGTFNYRIELVKNSIGVIKDNFFFGTIDPNRNGALEVMRQGQGIIDIVNSYLEIALYFGMVSLLFFSLIFLVLLKKLFNKQGIARKLRKQEEFLIGAVLIALTLATIVFIGTVSSISYIPIYYWSLIAIGSAYIRIMSNEQIVAERLSPKR